MILKGLFSDLEDKMEEEGDSPTVANGRKRTLIIKEQKGTVIT